MRVQGVRFSLGKHLISQNTICTVHWVRQSLEIMWLKEVVHCPQMLCYLRPHLVLGFMLPHGTHTVHAPLVIMQRSEEASALSLQNEPRKSLLGLWNLHVPSAWSRRSNSSIEVLQIYLVCVITSSYWKQKRQLWLHAVLVLQDAKLRLVYDKHCVRHCRSVPADTVIGWAGIRHSTQYYVVFQLEKWRSLFINADWSFLHS